MIGAFVRFSFDQEIDEQKIRGIAEQSRAKFEGMPGLRSKAFTYDAKKREATNFYVWQDEAAARAFYTEEMQALVAQVYGVRPSIEFVEIATLVDNGA